VLGFDIFEKIISENISENVYDDFFGYQIYLLPFFSLIDTFGLLLYHYQILCNTIRLCGPMEIRPRD